MAKARALDKRRKSIRNIRKITRTMELVATAQFRRAMERAVSAGAYTQRIAAMVADLARAGASVSHPLLEERQAKNGAALLVLTANRGMCGGYNSSILRKGHHRADELKNDYEKFRLLVSGKRGISYAKDRGIELTASYDQFNDKPQYEDVVKIADYILSEYLAGKIDRFEVAYMKFISVSKQVPVVETLLPLSELASDEAEDAPESKNAEYEFLPSPESILEEIVPTAFRVKLFKCFLDAAVGEQIARRVAMKAATDNADSMISILTTTYNRARQGQITNEIIEVVSGASALQG
ncbi:MAG: ATP synthase F1 subunit gamma [Thermoguttaceae bacterium]|nr:ATP synthase F1 subunit gamma [Thermoguttaceae bacterium]